MNIFRLVGDLSHLLAIIVLLRKIWKTRSCAVATEEDFLIIDDEIIADKSDKDFAEHYGTFKASKKAIRAELPGVHDPTKLKPDEVAEKAHNTDTETVRKELKVTVEDQSGYSVKFSDDGGEEPNVNWARDIWWTEMDRRFTVIMRRRVQKHTLGGISGKSQILFAVVYTTRYLDLVTTYVSLYNTLMKLFFIAASYATCYLIYVKFKATYDHNHDTFRVEFLLAPALILALLINHDFTFLEILWTFSIYLESVAILPQLFMVSKTGEAESITSHYLFALGSYRGLYILNWVYRYMTENTYDLIAIVAGIVQTVLYCDFFYLYITKVLRGKKLQLPA